MRLQRTWVLAVWLGTAVASAQEAPPDEALWASVELLARSSPASAPFEARFGLELARRRGLLERTQTYLRIYPGGRRRDEAIALELETLFEIASLAGDYAPLAERIRGLESAPPSDAARAEAAWWRIHCDRARATDARREANSPTTGDAEILAAYRVYVDRFPRAGHALHALVRLADDALSRGDFDAAERWVGQLERDFAGNAIADVPAARLRMERNVGQPFAARLRTVAGEQIDTAALAGSVVLICVWDSSRPGSSGLAKEIEAFLAEAPGRKAIGVCIAESVEATIQATRGLTWPQCNDGLGRGGEFARRWGIRAAPAIIVLDRSGRLVGCGDSRTWRSMAEAATSGPTDAPGARR